MTTAHVEGLRCIGVKETDDRHAIADFALEKERARTGGKNADGVADGQTPVHALAEQNLRLLDEVCFTPFRREAHEIEGMITEILRQARIAPHLGAVPEGVPPAQGAPDFEPEPEPEDGGWEPEPEPE